MPEYQTVRKLVSEEIDSGNLPWNYTSEVPPFPVFEVALLLHFLAKQLHSHCIAGVATEQAERPRKYNIGGTGVRTDPEIVFGKRIRCRPIVDNIAVTLPEYVVGRHRMRLRSSVLVTAQTAQCTISFRSDC